MSINIKSVNKGAELVSINLDGEERLHDGNTAWNRHSPILFPMVGRLQNDETQIEGNLYHMTQHGFARDMEFENLEYTDKLQSYLLKSNKETKTKYPYDFSLQVTYIVENNKLITSYKVTNTDTKDIYFGIGAHPAYKMNYENCYLEFEQEETNILFYQLDEGLISSQYHKQLRNNKIIDLYENTFEKDAIIMQNINSNKLYIKDKTTNKKILEFCFEKFPYLAIWSKPNAPFLCIEPWYTTADKKDSDSIFKNKLGTICLKPNEEFSCQYYVIF